MLSPAGDAREEDVLSIRASENQAIVDEWVEDQGDVESYGSYTQDASGHSSLRGSVASQKQTVIKPAVKMALARLGLDVAPAQVGMQIAFFKQAPSTGFLACLLQRLSLKSYRDAGQTLEGSPISPVTAGPWLICRMQSVMGWTTCLV